MRKFTFLLLLLSIHLITFSQKNKPKRWCHVSAYNDSTFSDKNISKIPNTQSRLDDPDGLIIIPVVFHVLYNNSSENISDQQILSQIERLNTDFRNQNPEMAPYAPWQSLKSDLNIEFRLACIDPTGNPTNGITRTFTNQAQFLTHVPLKFTSMGGKDAWPTESYLNIWIGDLDDPSGFLGHAQFPYLYYVTQNGIPGNLLDGIVLDYTIVGDNSTASNGLGRIAVHEAGHWLGLQHPFWEVPGCFDDQVADTPLQGIPTLGCPSFPVTDNCSPSFPGIMFMNYMDYTDDGCRYMFSQGQRSRARSFIANPGSHRNVFLENYFGIVPFTNNLAVTGNNGIPNQIKVDLKNPACLNPSAFVSNPLTIVDIQDQYVILEVPSGICSGLVTLTTTHGNYLSEYSFSFNTPSILPLPTFTTPHNNGVALQLVLPLQTYTCEVVNEPGYSYEWTIEGYTPGVGGGIILSGQGTSQITFLTNTCDAARIGVENEINSASCFVLITVKKVLSVNCKSTASSIIFHYDQCPAMIPCCDPPTVTTCCHNCNRINVYPNPSSTYLMIELLDKSEFIDKIEIIDKIGIPVLSVRGGQFHTKDVSLISLNPGIYFIRVFVENKIYTKQISKID